jgi:hypothetical protein
VPDTGDRRINRSPFLLQFGVPIATSASVPFRYDSERQIGQIFTEQGWIDAIDVPEIGEVADTRFRTEVARETTDDR